MRQKLPIFLFFLSLLFFQNLLPISSVQKALAITTNDDCKIFSIDPNPPKSNETKINSLTINTKFPLPGSYKVFIDAKGGDDKVRKISVPIEFGDKQIIINTPFNKNGEPAGGSDLFEENTTITFWVASSAIAKKDWYGTGNNFLDMDNVSLCRTTVEVDKGIGPEEDENQCNIIASGAGAGEAVHLKVNFTNPKLTDSNQTYSIAVAASPSNVEIGNYGPHKWQILKNPGIQLSKRVGDKDIPDIYDIGTYQARVIHNGWIGPETKCASLFTVTADGVSTPDNKYDSGQGLFACVPERDTEGNTKYYTCQTAIGEVKTDPEGFIKTVLSLILGLAGGILLIVIILNGYKFIFSQGDPEKIKDAREGIVAAIMGIFLIIFSLTLLTIVTSNILQIPGFGN